MLTSPRTHTVSTLLITVLVAGSFAVAPVAAQEENGGDEEGESDTGGDAIINLDEVAEAIQELTDEFQEFTGSWNETLKQVLITVIFQPFRTLAQQLVKVVALVLTTTPNVHPNPAVEEVHRDILLVTYMVSGLVFMTAGILYQIGPVLGISYAEIRRILPRLVVALVFGTVSLPLLQLGIDLSNAFVSMFQLSGLTMSMRELIGLETGILLAWVINAWALLGVVLLFLIRDVYILFVAAISPLLALVWSIPRAKRYADTFIAGWFAALAIAPLDLLVLRFSLALMRGTGDTAIQSISNWILGVASLILLLLVPYQVWQASQSAVGTAYRIGGTVKRRVRNKWRSRSKTGDSQQGKRGRRRRRRNRSWEDDDD